MKVNSERVIFLDYLRIAACFMVMLIHAVEPYYFDEAMNLSIKTKSDAIWVSLLDSAARACVPLFVMTSCYLLFPLKLKVSDFFKRRMARVAIPFFIWAIVYICHFSGNFKELFFNFPSVAGHLWFVPMLFGLYLAMPIFSPWAEKVSKRELIFWIGIWAFTAFFPFFRRLSMALLGAPAFGSVAYLWGECAWNEFGAFQYVSGFFGYMLLALYFRKFGKVISFAKSLLVATPIFAVGLAIMSTGFYFRIPGVPSFPITAPYAAAVDVEMSIEYCSIGVALATFAIFLVFRNFTADGWFYRKIIVPVSEASFGAYLMHIIILVPICSMIKGRLPMPIAAFGIATLTFIISIFLSVVFRKIPYIGKTILG